MFLSPHQVLTALTSVGYITDQITATVVHLAARLNKPILLEGPPGSGKTELAYAVAKATRTEVERLQGPNEVDGNRKAWCDNENVSAETDLILRTWRRSGA